MRHLLCLIVLSLPVSNAQPPRPAFDVASIKLNPSLSLRHVILPPVGGRLSTRNASLRLLIQTAYGVQTFQIQGGPGWMNTAGYDLDAKAEGTPTRAEVWLMLQSLLENRFALRAHRETRELPVYALTAAKGGLKLPTPTSDCLGAGAIPTPPEKGQPPLTRCGELQIAVENGRMYLEGRQITMADAGRTLSAIFDRAVVDKTGFTGKFDAVLRFTPDDATVGVVKPSAIDDSAPSLLAALQEQLGLKVEPAKGPVEVLVIDHVERPSEN